MNEWLNRFRAWFDGLARREKMLVSVAGGVIGLSLVMLLGVQPLLAARTAAEERAETAEQRLEAVKQVRERFDDVSGRLGAVEQRIQSGQPGNLLATLQDLAQQSAVTLDSIEPRTAPASPPYRETKLQVTLGNATLPQLVRYLHLIESAPQVLSIKSLRIRLRADDSKQLEVSFTVSSFERV
ncbi:MAG TPA: type II secretion system protein GspM [Myxococcota bacterium]|nr:type II secretion system protein GspM [Myxococcota bacterium]